VHFLGQAFGKVTHTTLVSLGREEPPYGKGRRSCNLREGQKRATPVLRAFFGHFFAGFPCFVGRLEVGDFRAVFFSLFSFFFTSVRVVLVVLTRG
jgi:hypothetical protein